MKIVGWMVVGLLALAIFGSAGWLLYRFVYKPEIAIREEIREVAETPVTPPPDLSLPALDAALALEAKGEFLAARQALRDFLLQYPDSSRIAEAKRALGELNASLVLSAQETPEKVRYTVVSGDALVKIANKTDSSAELIFRANNLESINLQIGQELLVPKVVASVEIDLERNAVTLYDNGQFFAEYPIVSYKGPKLREGMSGKVVDKIAMKDGRRTAFGSKEYTESDRLLQLSPGFPQIREIPREEGSEASGPGILLEPADFDELYLLVTRGTPVAAK